MYFLISKLLWLVFAPSSFLILCICIASALIFWGKRRAGFALGGSALFILTILSFSPVAEKQASELEDRFPPATNDERPINGAIILGGGLNLASSVVKDRLVLGGAGDRLLAMADLARRHPEAKIIFTGGSGYLAGSKASEADLIEQHLSRLGITPGRILFERASRNTYENAIMTKAMVNQVQGERWLLVTSALHMPRAMGLFRAAGIDLEAYPVDWRTARGFTGILGDEPASSRLRLFDSTIREIIGLIAVRITGQSRELFPTPR
ncbi:MAG: YdcF family protein [Hyphomicrobiales bacterium]